MGLTLPRLVKMLKPYGVNNWKLFRWEIYDRKIPMRIERIIPWLLKSHVEKQATALDASPTNKADDKCASPPPVAFDNERVPAAPIKNRPVNLFPGRWPTSHPVRRKRQLSNSNITVRSLLIDYYFHTEEYGANRWERPPKFWRYSESLIQFFGNKQAEQLTSSDLADYVKKRAFETVDWVVHRELVFLAYVYYLAFRRGFINKRISVTGENSEDFFTHEHYQRQLVALQDYAKDVTRFAYLAGWEQGEIFCLQWDSNHDPQRTAMLFDGRVFPLVDERGKHTELYELIEERKKKRVNDCPWIFHHNGRRLCKNTFNKEWRRACSLSGVSRFFRELRPAAARNLRIAGFEPKQVIMLTGYTKPVPVSYLYEIVETDQPAPEKTRQNNAHAPRRWYNNSKATTSRPPFKTLETDEELFGLMADLGVV